MMAKTKNENPAKVLTCNIRTDARLDQYIQYNRLQSIENVQSSKHAKSFKQRD